MNKKDLSERDICTKYITPAIKQSGWDPQKKKYKDRLDGALKMDEG